MSPFAGEGVNLALMDAYELGRELVGAVHKGARWNRLTKDLGFRLFKKAMWQKAGEKGEESLKNLNALFAVHALRLSSLMDLHQVMMCKVR
jgi:2-polyprenyl-6-methoxyphenol hydroxylase-like FAD-dependent oxidoreductase